jgi:hypothetical protein
MTPTNTTGTEKPPAVSRPDYGEWLKVHQHPYPHPGIAASELGQLGGGPWRSWNLADAADRTGVLAEIRNEMTGPGFALFDLVESEDDLVRELLARDVPGTWFVTAAEYLVFLGRREDAAAVINRYLERLGKPWGTGWYADRLPQAIARWNLPVQLRVATAEEARQMADAARRREDAMASAFGFSITRHGEDE